MKMISMLAPTKLISIWMFSLLFDVCYNFSISLFASYFCHFMPKLVTSTLLGIICFVYFQAFSFSMRMILFFSFLVVHFLLLAAYPLLSAWYLFWPNGSLITWAKRLK